MGLEGARVLAGAVFTAKLSVAVISAVLGKRFIIGGGLEVLASTLFIVVGLGLYFLPVYLAKLWIKNHDSALPLLRPTEEVLTQSLCGSFPFKQKHDSR